MKRSFIALLLLSVLLVSGCTQATSDNNAPAFSTITASDAKRLMDEKPNEIVLDVREQQEYDAGHIENAVLLPVNTITAESAAKVIPSKDTPVLVYCRSGNRSRTAADKLAQLGYTEIYDFGGINRWSYGTVAA